ncbi:Suppressor of the cold-sensitive snRNP biogenesis mutant brr1-1 [Ceratobasidium sp. 395]|nr:Suppressor of the cold-sensitive snRNP biogenesis mutant brr1-1 [Ceratobasidium sp. 395]
MIIASVIAYGVLFCATTSGTVNAASILPPSFIHSPPQSFIVKLKPGFEADKHVFDIKAKAKTRIGKTTVFDSRVFHGYAVELNPADQAVLAKLDEVEYVEPDAVMSVASDRIQTSAPWGLQAITRSTVNAGIHVVVAAGNGAVDASDWSPARVPSVIAVGNVDINGIRAESSNYGSPIGVFAPGVDIVSAGTSGPNATRVDSGTSMAAPHVAGLVAYLLAFEGPRTPAEMKTRIQSLALAGILGNIPNGTVNLMLRNLF